VRCDILELSRLYRTREQTHKFNVEFAFGSTGLTSCKDIIATACC